MSEQRSIADRALELVPRSPVQSHSVLLTGYTLLFGALRPSPAGRKQISCSLCSLFARLLTARSVKSSGSHQLYRCRMAQAQAKSSPACRLCVPRCRTVPGRLQERKQAKRYLDASVQGTDAKRPSGCHLKAKPLFVLAYGAVCEKGCLSIRSCQLQFRDCRPMRGLTFTVL